MGNLWDVEMKYQKWLDVEIAVCEAWAEIGEIPRDALKLIKEKARFDVRRIDEIEKVVKHDVIAFLTSVAQSLGPESRFIHKGLTSSDILDTALALQICEACDLIMKDIRELMDVLKKQAYKYKDIPAIGRSHGVHAEPMTFGLKFALWHEEMKRNLARMKKAKEAIRVGKLSGAVGTFSNIPPVIEEKVCKKLGLKPEPVATQIVQRDRHAEYFTTLAIIASSLDKFSQEVRLLQRTEVREAEEYFTPGQKGSSAMPHKRNPVLSENLSGLARLIRSYAQASLEDIALWHERDISHSSVERVIAPDATILLDFMLSRFCGLVEKLVVYPDRMLANLNMTRGVIFSQMVLLKLIERGMTRENAYSVVQKSAMKSWLEDTEFMRLLVEDDEVMSFLSSEDINNVFKIENFLTHTDFIFKRAFGEE